LTFQYKLPTRRSRTLPAFPIVGAKNPLGRPPRVARLVALAHKLEAMVQSGLVPDYGELARRARISPARIAQIVLLGQLAPEIQEYILFLSREYSGLITERHLRDIARELRWERQRKLFGELLSRRG
jgi:hypothetical protein